MGKRLFCEISPVTYQISKTKSMCVRYAKWVFDGKHYAKQKSMDPLSHAIYKHASLIRRKLGDVDTTLQDNKAVNLKIATAKVTGILIEPGETFSFWRLVGNPTEKKGYLDGLVLKSGQTDSAIGGGMCQFTNLIHWMILHSPLEITEHHHHDGYDLFPDYNRQIPFGTGTSVLYNYLDYQFYNATPYTFQMLVYTTGTHLHGELLCTHESDKCYHISEENACFTKEADGYYRHNVIVRTVQSKRSGTVIEREQMKVNRAKVMYDAAYINPAQLK